MKAAFIGVQMSLQVRIKDLPLLSLSLPVSNHEGLSFSAVVRLGTHRENGYRATFLARENVRTLFREHVPRL